MELFIYIAIGAILAMACLLPVRGKSLRGLAVMAYVYFAAMIFIYWGAYLVTGDETRLLKETIGVIFASGLAITFKRKWPMGLALLILSHGLYDGLLGHSSGVMEWYPPICLGFDIVAGLGFLILMKRARKT